MGWSLRSCAARIALVRFGAPRFGTSASPRPSTAGGAGRRPLARVRSARRRPRRARAPAGAPGSRAPVIRQARSRAAFRAHGLGVGRARGASPPPRHPAARSARRPPRGAWSARSPPARQVREGPRSCGDEGAGLTQTTRARDPARRRTHSKSARARRHALPVRRSASQDAVRPFSGCTTTIRANSTSPRASVTRSSRRKQDPAAAAAVAGGSARAALMTPSVLAHPQRG